MASTEKINKLVTLLNEDGFQDGYWCNWLVISFPDFEFDWEYKRNVLEPIVSSVKYTEYDEDTDEEFDQDVAAETFKDALRVAFAEKGHVVNIEDAAFVFVGQ